MREERPGDGEKRRMGNAVSGRNGDADKRPIATSPTPAFSSSPSHPVSASLNHPLASSDLRILLWDIDGTLIHSLKSGGYKIYTLPVLEEIFGTSGQLVTMHVSGMTDLQIIAEALREEGFTHEDIRKQIHQVSEKLTAEARRVTGSGEPFFELLPGAENVLQVLDENPRYQSALLTGNVEPMAWLKMELVGLEKYFKLPGAFGEESHQRRDLPERAAERINNFLKLQLAPEQFIVIGDTPNDIDCARHFGARAVAVGTGRVYSKEEMLACKPDAWLEDLSDAELVVNTLDAL
jgi:phosphoglycolate phosphatase